MSWIVLGLLIVIVVFSVTVYNALITARNGFKNAFSQIDVQLQRRHDLIPNLVETAKGYLKHEQETLEAVTQARNQAVAGLKAASSRPGDAKAMQQLDSAETGLAGALARGRGLDPDHPLHLSEVTETV